MRFNPVLLIAFLAIPSIALIAQSSYDLKSPDNRIEVRIRTSGQLRYDVLLRGDVLLENSTLSLDVEHKKLGAQPKVTGEKRRTNDQVLEPVVRQKFAKVRDHYNELRLTLDGGYAVTFRAYDQGVAYRFETTLPDKQVKIYGEEANFNFPTNFVVYYPQEDTFYSHNERKYLPQHLSEIAPMFIATLPAVIDVGHGAKLAIAESDLSDYPGLWLAGAAPQFGLKATFPPYPLKEQQTSDRDYKVVEAADYIAVTSGTRSFPWRVLGIADRDGDLITNQLVYLLESPSKIQDTSWIKPGRASWAWWSYPDGPATAERFNEFTDFAAKMGWEYTLFDAGWWTPGLKPISDHALSEGVMPLAWLFATDFYYPDRSAKKLDEIAAAGVRGVKVDFWCSDRQEAIAAQQRLMKEAAARKLAVNLHGCTIPRGWQRTWPNFLTCEAVLGTESYFYEPRYSEKAAELNTVLPFTRNAVGPMDVTPVAVSPKKYARTTTAAHELAAAIIVTSGIIHYADRPEFFESLPPAALKVFRDAPARWDETRCLVGEPGRVAIFARRSGKSWFIAGINGTTNDLSVTLDLSAFKKLSRRLMISEGTDANRQVAVSSVAGLTEWKHEIPPRGGFILRLDQ